MKKKITSLLLALVMLFSLIPAGAITAWADPPSWYTSGNGTEATPYIISTYDGLIAFAEAVNGGTETTAGKFYKLADNFGKGSGTAEALTTPISNSDGDGIAFGGTFDGNGKEVVLNINSDAYFVGLFGYVYSGSVKNVTVSGSVTATTEFSYVGGVAGLIEGGGSVTNCCATCTVTDTEDGASVGGVVGYNSGSVTNCSASGNVTGSAVGGVVGYNRGSVTNCYATGVVTGGNGSYVGGVVGYNEGGSVTNCYATGTVSNGFKVGGVVGSNTSAGSVTNCYATGTVTGSSNSKVGGVVGNSSSGTTVTNCYYKDGIATLGVGNVNTDIDASTLKMVDANMKAAETSTDSLVYKLNSYLTTTSTPGAKPWKVDSEVNGGYPTFMDVSYQSYVEGTGFETATCDDYTVVTKDTTTFENGKWYVVNSDVEFASGKNITVSGTANLILCDGASLTVTSPGSSNAAICVASGKTLNIYGQTAGTGTLTATGGQGGAGIGNGTCGDGGNVTINGGTVTAKGGGTAAGIGGGTAGNGGNVTINGGTVTAAGGAGIGKGYNGNSNGSLTVAAGMTIKAGANAAGAVEKTAAQALGMAYVNITKADPVAFVDLNGNGSFDEASETKYATVQDAINAASAATAEKQGTVKLLADVDLTECVEIAKATFVTLDLNGHVLTVFGVYEVDGQLTITDSDPTVEHKFDSTASPWKLNGSGDTTVFGGVITGFLSDDSNLINIEEGGILVMKGGNIVGNKGCQAGAVDNKANATFTMTGGSIRGNAAFDGGVGGIRNATSSTITLGGTAVIADNKNSGGAASNLYLRNGKTVTIASGSPLKTGASIGVTLENLTGDITSNGTADDAKYFTSDDPTYKVKFVDKVTEPSEVPAHLELVNYTVTKLTDITTGITLEKSDMTADQAIAIAKAEFTDPAKQTKVFYKTVGTDPVQYGYVYFNKTWKAASSLYAFDELIKTVGNYPTLDFYVIGTITEKTKVTLDATVANVVAYTGSAVTNPTVTAKEGDSTVTLTKALSFTYYDTTAPTVALEGAPTTVGSYKLVIQVAADEPNYYGESLEKTFSINKGTNTISGLKIADWTVGGTASQPSITSTLFGDNQVTYEYKVKGAEDSTYKAYSAETAPTAAGKYTLRATSTGDGTNYDAGTATVDFTVKEQSRSIIQIIVDAVGTHIRNYVVPAVKTVVKNTVNFFRNIFR